MENDPRNEHLVSLMIGHRVVVEYMGGPPTTEEDRDQLEKGEALTANPKLELDCITFGITQNSV